MGVQRGKHVQSMASIKIWFRSDGAMMHPSAKQLFLREVSAMSPQTLGKPEATIAVHTVETEDILIAGRSENVAHCTIEHIGSVSPAVTQEHGENLGALLKVHYHVVQHFVRFVGVQPHEMIISPVLQGDIDRVRQSYSYQKSKRAS